MERFRIGGLSIRDLRDAIRESLQEFNLPLPRFERNMFLKEFGEVCVSWYLETHDGLILIRLQWVESPLSNRTGVDIIGVSPQIDICYIEVKTRSSNSNISSAICCNTKSLADELSDTRLQRYIPKPNNPQGIINRTFIYYRLMELADSGRLRNITKETLRQELEIARHYVRYGAIVHPEGSKNINDTVDRSIQRAFVHIDNKCYRRENCDVLRQNGSCPQNCPYRNPIIFLDMSCENFNSVFQDFISVVNNFWLVIYDREF